MNGISVVYPHCTVGELEHLGDASFMKEGITKLCFPVVIDVAVFLKDMRICA